MERVRVSSAPIASVYDQLTWDWLELSDLFEIDTEKGVPTLGLFSRKGEGRPKLEIYPQSAPERFRLKLDFLADDGLGITRYFEEDHLVSSERFEDEVESSNALVHETTHAVVRIPNANVEVNQTGLMVGNDYPVDLVGRLGFALGGLQINHFVVDMNEFFPPIGQAFLMGGCYVRWSVDLSKAMDCYFQNIHSFEPNHIRYVMKNVAFHLPEVAGERLVDVYKGDVRTLRSEHPGLGNMEVWRYGEIIAYLF